MVGWYHCLNGHEVEQTPGNGEGQGSLVCCSPQGPKEPDTTEGLTYTHTNTHTHKHTHTPATCNNMDEFTDILKERNQPQKRMCSVALFMNNSK